jgi:hypothetical protein
MNRSDTRGLSCENAPPRAEPAFTEGCEVVHGEYFSHTDEPVLTFYRNRVYVNTACLKALPQISYVQFLIHPQKRILLLRPGLPQEKDAFRWCSADPQKRRPRHIPCPAFSAMLFPWMGWNPSDRIRLLGRLLSDRTGQLLAFDLTAPECFAPPAAVGPPPPGSEHHASCSSRNTQMPLPGSEHHASCSSRNTQMPLPGSEHHASCSSRNTQMPRFRADWALRFGTPVHEHQNLLVQTRPQDPRPLYTDPCPDTRSSADSENRRNTYDAEPATGLSDRP